MAKRKQKSGGDIPEWIVTYGDLMSLLLCFFILLAAFSELKDPDEFRKVIVKIQEALGLVGGPGQIDVPDVPANSVINELTALIDLADDKSFTNVQNDSNVSGREDKVSVVHDGNYHTVGTTLWFDSGVDDLSPDTQNALRTQVAPQIRDRQNIVRIVGHAWGAADAAEFGSYDEAAWARALAIKRFLVDEAGVDARILRVEVASNHEPFAGDPNAAGAGGPNRRVQVYLTDRLLTDVNRDAFGTGR